MFKKFNIKNKTILKSFDLFIHLLFVKNVIIYGQNHANCNQLIIKDNKLWYNVNGCLFSTFFQDNIFHMKCKRNHMKLCYKHNKPTMYCHKCEQAVKLVDNKKLYFW